MSSRSEIDPVRSHESRITAGYRAKGPDRDWLTRKSFGEIHCALPGLLPASGDIHWTAGK
jgi:hypothetical protein